MEIKNWSNLWLVMGILCTVATSHAGDEIYTGFFDDKALRGYDAVAYFTEGQPVKGNKQFKLEYKSAIWLFSSKENQETFAANPAKYAPQYGGHCAWAVGANAARAPGDPQYWKIVNDKLYLNFNEEVQQKWQQDISGFIEKADQHWPEMLLNP